LKIILNECHKNKFNAFSQVGLIAVNVLGDYTSLPNELPNASSTLRQENIHQLSEDDHMQVDNKTKLELSRLNELKLNAVANEDYEEAKRLKLKIDRFKLVVGQIHELELEKVRAVDLED